MERFPAMAKTMPRLGGACGHSNVASFPLVLVLPTLCPSNQKFYWGQRGPALIILAAYNSSAGSSGGSSGGSSAARRKLVGR